MPHRMAADTHIWLMGSAKKVFGKQGGDCQITAEQQGILSIFLGSHRKNSP